MRSPGGSFAPCERERWRCSRRPACSSPPRSSSAGARSVGPVAWIGAGAVLRRSLRAGLRSGGSCLRLRLAGRGSRSRARGWVRRLERRDDPLVGCARPVVGVLQPRARLPRVRRSSGAFVGSAVAPRIVVWLLGGLIGVTCLWALAEKAVPALYGDYGRLARLRSPVGYWNALALVVVFGLPLALWAATRRASFPRSSRRAPSSFSTRSSSRSSSRTRAGGFSPRSSCSGSGLR